MPDRTPSASRDDATDLLGQVGFVVMTEVNRLAAELDMSPTQLRVLGILRDRTPRVVDLAEYLGLEKSTVSGLLARSEQRGLVTRRSSARDARATEIEMTAAGHALADEGLARLGQVLAPLVDRLTSDEQRTLVALLRTVVGPDAVIGAQPA